MKIRQNVAWVGDSNRVVALELGVPTSPLVLTGDAAILWMSLTNKSEPTGGGTASVESSNELVVTLVKLGLIEK